MRLLVLADKVGATQYISFEQALADAAGDGNVELTMASDDKAWDDIAACAALWERAQPDTLVLSRYSEPRAMNFVALARERGAPIVFHIDDDLLDVPASLGPAKFDFYHQPQRLAALRAAMEAADLVYASTPALAERLREHGIQTPVQHGEVYCSVDPTRMTSPLPATAPVVGYMGTSGHSQDLALVVPVLERLMREVPQLRFETFGTIKPPPELAVFGDRCSSYEGVADYDAFVDKLCTLGWWVGLAPLEANGFNRCKADTKWVEYSFAGITTVASDLPVYHRGCADGAGWLAATSQAWHGTLSALIRDAGLRRRSVEAARQRLRDAYSRPLLQRQVLRIVEQARQR
jgi:hypothetical protein